MAQYEKDLTNLIDEKQCLNFLSKLVQQKSYTQTDGEKKLAHFMKEEMEKIGLISELSPVKGDRFNAIGYWRGQGQGKSLLFNGHIDTNPVTEGWTIDPWEGKIDDKFIYGIGISNMKSGDAAYFCAVKTLIDAGVKLSGDVILTYVVGELQGGIGTISAIEQGIKADYFINSEPTDLQALTLHAGAFCFEIELYGMTRHLSKREEAVDAITVACQLIPTLNQMTFSNAINDEHRSTNRCHVGVVHGALGKDLHEWRPPQVADFVKITGSCRYAPSQSMESVLKDLEIILKQTEEQFPGLKTKVFRQETKNEQPDMKPFEVSKQSKIVQTINAAYEQVCGHDQPTGAIIPPAFYGTDAAHFYQHLGMEGVVCGPGGRYNTMPDEKVDIPDYINMIKIYMLCIMDICQ